MLDWYDSTISDICVEFHINICNCSRVNHIFVDVPKWVCRLLSRLRNNDFRLLVRHGLHYYGRWDLDLPTRCGKNGSVERNWKNRQSHSKLNFMFTIVSSTITMLLFIKFLPAVQRAIKEYNTSTMKSIKLRDKEE